MQLGETLVPRSRRAEKLTSGGQQNCAAPLGERLRIPCRRIAPGGRLMLPYLVRTLEAAATLRRSHLFKIHVPLSNFGHVES